MKRRWLVLFLLLACTLPVAARLGGGESFSSGSSSSSSGGDAVGLLIELVFRVLFYLCLEYPVIGIPLTLAVVGAFLYVAFFTKAPQAATVATRYDGDPSRPLAHLVSVLPEPQYDPSIPDPAGVDPTAALLSVDPNFSKPLFLDSVNLLYPNYLITLPTCPAANSDTYSASFKSQSSPDAYSFYCSGLNHAPVGIPENFPQYNSTQGLIQQ